MDTNIIYNKLRFPVFKVESIDEIKEIGLYDEFVEIENTDMLTVMRYLCAMYDKHSPLISITNISRRKSSAARAANFPLTNGGIAKPYDDILTLEGSVGYAFGRMIVRYCRLQNETDLMQLFTFEEALARNNEMLLSFTNDDADDYTKTIKNINELNKSILDIRNRFLMGDDSKEASRVLLNYIMNESLSLKPEEIALQDKTRDWGIYEDYEFERFTEKDLNEKEKKKLERELVNDTDEARKHFEDIGVHPQSVIDELEKKLASRKWK